MKRIYSYILLILATGSLAISCRDDDAVRIPDFQTGVNARVILDPNKSYVNLSDLSKASVAFDIYSVNKDIDEITYTATFVDADSVEASFPSFKAFVVPGSAFVNGKAAALEITATQMAEKFGLPGGLSYLEGGDNITFTAQVKLKDGRIIDATNSAPSITGGGAASFTTAFTVYVGCPSDVNSIVGTYYSIMEYNDAGEPTGDTVVVTVTFAGPEPFRYQVTDHTVELYKPYGGKQYPATFYDLCGVAILQPTTSFGNVVNFSDPSDSNFLPPVIEQKDGTTQFVLNWWETFNNIKASVRFVKKK
jgi:hypothetical protein